MKVMLSRLDSDMTITKHKLQVNDHMHFDTVNFGKQCSSREYVHILKKMLKEKVVLHQEKAIVN